MNSSKIKEYKKIQVPFLLEKSNLSEDNEYFTFSGYGSTFDNIDRDQDVIEKGAFNKTIEKIISKGDNLPILWQHDMSIPLGIYIKFAEDEKGLFVKGRMPKDDSFVRERVMPQMKIGSVRKLSIGFFIKEWEFETREGKSVRIIKEVELFEISLVTIPANEEASVTEIKAATPYKDLPLAARDLEWSKEDALGRVRRFTGSTEEPSTKYKNAFFWYDENNEELFGAYKLPFVDIVDGSLHAVPRAIFAVAAALRGARGGVNIPEDDRQKVIANVNRYYDKMRNEFNDEGIISPFKEDVKGLINKCNKLSDIETILKKHYFSNKESEMIISKISEIKRLGDQVILGEELESSQNREVKEIIQGLKEITQAIQGD